MNVKKLLGQAIEAHIAGDTAAASQAIRTAVTNKAKQMIGESERKLGKYGEQLPREMDSHEFLIPEVEFQLNGETYLGSAIVAVRSYIKPTAGNHSPVAPDPSTYFGDEEELEWDVVEIFNYCDEDGNFLPVLTDADAHAVFSERELDRLENQLLDMIHGTDDTHYDQDHDRYERY